MQIFRTKQALSAYVSAQKQAGKTVGFTPTMGALHRGHLSLMERSKKENDISLCSIYVNPTQFNNPDDLKHYPRVEDQDITLLEGIQMDALYLPDHANIYPEGFQLKSFDFQGIDRVMEGEFREGHFQGMANVVHILLSQVLPDNAYFGEKDFQQLQLVRRLVALENLPTKIVGMPIAREDNGLAMSSRNRRLSPEEFAKAAMIFKSLKKAQQLLLKNIKISEIKAIILEDLSLSGLELEYFTLADEVTLQPILNPNEAQNARIFIAVYAGKIRLIDNLAL